MFRPAARLSFVVMIVSGVALGVTGDIQGKLMFEQQPMKMASAESLCDTETGASFSLLTVGTHNNCESVVHLISIPGLTSFLAENDFGATVQGVNQLQEQYEEQFGPGNYKPNLFVTYWAFRMMIGLAAGSALLALAGLWVTRGGRVPHQRWFSAGRRWSSTWVRAARSPSCSTARTVRRCCPHSPIRTPAATGSTPPCCTRSPGPGRRTCPPGSGG